MRGNHPRHDDPPEVPRLPARMRIAAGTIALVIVGLWTIVTLLSITGREQTLQRARTHADNLARVLEEHSHRMLQAADALARAHVEAAERGTPAVAHALVAAVSGQAIRQVTVTDADGRVRWSSTPAAGADLRGAAAFSLARSAGGEFVIGATDAGPRSGEWSFPLVRAIAAQDGRFAGAVLVWLDANAFTGLYADIDLGNFGAVTLTRIGDGAVLARHRGGEFQLPRAGERFGTFPIPPGTTLHTIKPGFIDGVERVYAFRDVPGGALRVAVGLATLEVLAPVRQRATLAFGMVAVVTLVLGFALHRMLGEARKLDAARAAEARARTEAEAAHAAKSTFLAHMSHEIRTPLAAILGTVDAMRADPRPDRLTDRTEAIRRTALALKQLLDDVLDLSRLEASALVVAPRAFRPRELLDEMLAPYRVIAESKGVAIAVDDTALPDTVIGDPLRIRQVLFNLVGNAVKYTTWGTISVRCAWLPATGRLSFVVADTGSGLSPAARAHLFEPFVASTPATTDAQSGAGLGLAICHRLVTAMGGAIRADLARPVGAAFTFEVPVATPDTGPHDGPLAPATDTTAAANESAARARRLRVLLAEDHPLILDVERTMLEHEGFEVVTATNGVEAVAKAVAAPFDAVLMDLRMPGLDGHGAARAIRASEDGFVRVPIIALTADPTESMRAGDGADFDATVVKPADWTRVRDLIVTLAARIPSRAAA